MAPATPFFTETMYQNLRRCQPGAPESVHFCPYPTPPEGYKEDMQIQQSVGRMQKVRPRGDAFESDRIRVGDLHHRTRDARLILRHECSACRGATRTPLEFCASCLTTVAPCQMSCLVRNK